MKAILTIILVIALILFAVITSVLAAYKKEIWSSIEFKWKK